jgi:hypothetical protein
MSLGGDDESGVPAEVDAAAIVPLLVQLVPIGTLVALGWFVIPNVILPLGLVGGALFLVISQPLEEDER